MGLRGMGLVGVNRIYVAQDLNRGRAILNTTVSLRAP